MANLNRPGIRIQVPVSIETEEGVYQTALYYPPDEFGNIDDKALDAEAQARADAWVAFVREQSGEKPLPTPEEMAARLDANVQAALQTASVEWANYLKDAKKLDDRVDVAAALAEREAAAKALATAEFAKVAAESVAEAAVVEV